MSRAAPSPPGGRAPRRRISLPMANATVLTRAMTALVILNGLKLAIRYLIVATAPMSSLIALFGAYNAISVAPFALWAMNGPPLPKSGAGAIRQAALTTLAMQIGLGLPDTILYVRELMVRTPDTVQVVLQVIIHATPYVMTGLLELALVAGLGYAILKLRMPPAPRHRAAARPSAPPPAATPRRS